MSIETYRVPRPEFEIGIAFGSEKYGTAEISRHVRFSLGRSSFVIAITGKRKR